MFCNKDLENRQHDHRYKIGRLTHARTEENVITAKELVDPLRQEGQKQTRRLTRQIAYKKGWI